LDFAARRQGARDESGGKGKLPPSLFPPIAEIADSFLLPPPRQICHVSFSVSPDSEPPPHGILLYSPVIQSLHPSRVMEGGAVEIGMHFLLFLVFFLAYNTRVLVFLTDFDFG
jgi:hypothetical protein